MNTLREAIYESAAIESFKLKLRWTLQMLLAVTAAWVEFSVILVWYWTGRDSGPAAHQYPCRCFGIAALPLQSVWLIDGEQLFRLTKSVDRGR